MALAQTPGVYKVIVEKQEEKKRSRWTLADWLLQKKNNRMMDLWLAKNSYSSPFEFYLDGSIRNYNYVLGSAPDQHTNFNAQGGELGAFAGRAGIRGSFGGHDAHKHPPCRAINGHEEIAPGSFVRHLRQVFDVHMDETGFVGFEGLWDRCRCRWFQV